MNEWGFIGQGILVGIGKSAINNIFKKGVAMCETRDQCFLIPTHHSCALLAAREMNKTAILKPD